MGRVIVYKSRKGLAGPVPLKGSLVKARQKYPQMYLGPRGGKWMDPEHTIPWREPKRNKQGVEVTPNKQLVYYRGTKPGDTRRIKTGEEEWDKHLFVAKDPERARAYGSQIERVTLHPHAKVLFEGTRDFNRVAGKWKPGVSLLDYSTAATKKAEKEGYHAVHFAMQTDVGTAVMDHSVVHSREHAPEHSEKMEKTIGPSGGGMPAAPIQGGGQRGLPIGTRRVWGKEQVEYEKTMQGWVPVTHPRMPSGGQEPPEAAGSVSVSSGVAQQMSAQEKTKGGAEEQVEGSRREQQVKKEALGEGKGEAAATQPQAEEQKPVQEHEIESAYDAFQKRDKSWLNHTPGSVRNSPISSAVMTWMGSPEGKDFYIRNVASFGDYTTEAGSGEKPLEKMKIFNKSGENVAEAFTIKFIFGEGSSRDEEDYPTFNSKGVGDSVIELNIDSLFLNAKERGNNFSPQLYTRQEDFLRSITENLGEKEKANVAVTLTANADVGQYYWMTQGFRYANNDERINHLESLHDAVDRLIKVEKGEKKSNHLMVPVFDESGNQGGLKEAGYSVDELEVVKSLLRDAIDQAEDPDVHNDEKIEPWEVLELGPRGKGKFWVENVNYKEGKGGPSHVPCTLTKYLALAGEFWEGVKHVHGPTERDQEGIQVAEQRSAGQAMKSAKKGSPWSWLGEHSNTMLSGVQKSLRRIFPRKETFTVRFVS